MTMLGRKARLQQAGRGKAILRGCLLGTMLLALPVLPGQPVRADPINDWQAGLEMSADETRTMAAIGRLAGSDEARTRVPVCTATLVGPDLVATASHCLPAADGPSAVAHLRFAAGFYDGSWVAIRRGRYVIRSKEKSSATVDVALLRLDRPIPPTEIAPVPLELTPPLGALVDIIAFRNTGKARPVHLRPCSVTGLQTGFAFVDCKVISGNSGAPLLVKTTDTAPGGLAGIVVAHTVDGERRTIVRMLPADLRQVIAEGPAADGGRAP